jgi:hypothetical protein
MDRDALLAYALHKKIPRVIIATADGVEEIRPTFSPSFPSAGSGSFDTSR